MAEVLTSLLIQMVMFMSPIVATALFAKSPNNNVSYTCQTQPSKSKFYRREVFLTVAKKKASARLGRETLTGKGL